MRNFALTTNFSLSRSGSALLSAVGVIGWSLAYPHGDWEQFIFKDKGFGPLVAYSCDLIISLHANRARLSYHSHLLPDLLYALSHALSNIPDYETGDELRFKLVKAMLAVVSNTPSETLQRILPAQSSAVIALKLNKHLLTYFETLNASLLPLFSTYPRARIEDLPPNCLLLLGLTGLIEASGDPSCTGEIRSSELSDVFQRLGELGINWGSRSEFEPLVSAVTFDLRRYVFETMFNYYHRQLASESPESLSQCFSLLRSILWSRWDDVSWVSDLALNALSGAASDDLRDVFGGFLYHNAESVSKHPQVHNILYEMVRGSSHNSSSNFRWVDCNYLGGITLHFHRITATNHIDIGSAETAADALVERLIKDNLLSTLIYSAYASDERAPEFRFRQDTRCEDTTRFWRERIIALARKSRRQPGSDDLGDSTVADLLRDFCGPQSKSTITTDHNKDGTRASGSAYVNRVQWPLDFRLHLHLEQFKDIIRRELSKSSKSRMLEASNSLNNQIPNRTHQI